MTRLYNISNIILFYIVGNMKRSLGFDCSKLVEDSSSGSYVWDERNRE